MEGVGHTGWWRRLAIAAAAMVCLGGVMSATPANAQFVGVNVPFVGPVGVGVYGYPYYGYGYPYYYRAHYWGWRHRCHWWHHRCHYY